MATHVSAIVKFSDGSISFLRDDVSADTLTEIQTDASGILNIAPDLSVGVANQDKVATHCLVKVQTDSAQTGSFSHGAFYGTQGQVLSAVQGGGYRVGGLPKLVKPVRMQSGVTLKVQWQAVADSVEIASVAAYCASGKCDIFTATAVDDTNVSFTNKDGNTWGESLAGDTVVATYSTYAALNGLADTGVADGIDAFFVESASGQLLGMMAPDQGAYDAMPVAWVPQSIRVNQNDTATLRANV